MQMAAVPRGGIVVSVSVIPVPAIERSYLELRGENPFISALQLFPLFSSSLRNIVLDATSWKADEGTFIPFQPSYATRKIQDIIRPLCLPSPPGVLPVNPPEAISSKCQAETNLQTENTGVSAIPPLPLKLQPPSSERHEEMSYQPPPTLRVQFVNPITTAPETSSSSSSFSMPQLDVSTNDEKDEEENASGVTEDAERNRKKESRSRRLLSRVVKFVRFGCCKRQQRKQ
nr:uncharacterized protein LOC131792346 [Pocillopora verrucosa]